MIKVLFVCLGNICRSPMAEFLLKDMVKKKNRENEFIIETKGSGHGLGMDQYYGNYLAENEYSYTEILDYFFKDTKLSKMKE